MLFPRPEWLQFRERIAQLPMSAQWWKRIFLGNAMDVDMDGTGRVLVSPELRARAWTKRCLLGMGNHFERGTKPLTKPMRRKPCRADARRFQGFLFLKGRACELSPCNTSPFC